MDHDSDESVYLEHLADLIFMSLMASPTESEREFLATSSSSSSIISNTEDILNFATDDSEFDSSSSSDPEESLERFIQHNQPLPTPPGTSFCRTPSPVPGPSGVERRAPLRCYFLVTRRPGSPTNSSDPSQKQNVTVHGRCTRSQTRLMQEKSGNRTVRPTVGKATKKTNWRLIRKFVNDLYNNER